MRISTMSWLAVLGLTAGTAPVRAQSAAGPKRPESAVLFPGQRLLVAVSDDLATGDLLALRGGPPWRKRVVAGTAGGRHLRRFGNDAYLVNPEAGIVERVPLDGSPGVSFVLGPQSEPQDVHVATPPGSTRPNAVITRRHDARLFLADPATGMGGEATDLSPVGGGASIALGTMITDGERLFVQVKRCALVPGGDDTGVLAVLDRATLTLEDVDPLQPGVQGIVLQGAPPRLKMQILERTLFVSASEGSLDGRGAIERVDLDTLRSTGFALSERQVADLGGFVMTSLEAGYFVFHTDFAASTHLLAFTVQGGPIFNGEIVLLLGDTVDTLALDRANHRLYLPSGFAGPPTGIYVVDTRIDTQVHESPIPTAQRPFDVDTVP